MLDYFDQLTTAMRAFENQIRLARYKMRLLGYYTVEQEADDIGLEFAAGVGVDLRAGMNAYFTMLAQAYAGSYVGPDAETCDALYKDGWRDADGQFAHIPIGSLADEHHELCFRIRNIDREIEAHHVELNQAARPFPLLSPQEWQALSH